MRDQKHKCMFPHSSMFDPIDHHGHHQVLLRIGIFTRVWQQESLSCVSESEWAASLAHASTV